MTQRRPIVYNKGFIDILPLGDTVAVGDSPTEVIAGSGLSGGGSVSTEPRLDFAIAPNPSGLIYVEDAIGNDGVALANSTTALSNITDAISLGTNALASGNSALEMGTAALASGNAALDLIPDLSGGGGTQTTIRAGGPITKGCPVGINEASEAEQVGVLEAFSNTPGLLSGTIPAQAGQNGSVVGGIASSTVAIDEDFVFSFYRTSPNGYLGYTSTQWTGSGFQNSTTTIILSQNINGIAGIWDGGDYIVCTFNQFSATTGVTWGLFKINRTGAGRTLTLEGFQGLFGSGVYANQTLNLQLIKKKEPTGNLSYVCFSCDQGSAQFSIFAFEINYSSNALFFSSSNLTTYATAPIFGMYIEEASSWIGVDSNGVLYSNYFNGTSFTNLFATPVTVTDPNWYVTVSSCTVVDFGAPTSSTPDTVLFGVLNYEVDNSTSVYICSLTNASTSPVLAWGTKLNAPNSSRPNTAVLSCRLVNTPRLNTFTICFTNPNNINSQFLNNFKVDLGASTLQAGTLTNISSAMTVYTYPTLYPSENGYYFFDYTESTTADSYITLLNPPFTAAPSPTQNGLNNYLGAANSTVASGVPVEVSLPGTVVQYDGPSLPDGTVIDPGVFYYVSPASGSFDPRAVPPPPSSAEWVGEVEWTSVAKGVNPSGLLLTQCL